MATDKYYNYRPMLDLLGKSEGTDRGDGYNETLGYGAYTDGDVNLVGMTLAEVDALQTKMLRHPDNIWDSSACGRYQIVRTTRRSIEKRLKLANTEKFDEVMQDRMGCYLLGYRGIDEWLADRMTLKALVDNLAKEWASLPVYLTGKSYYSNQRASVTVQEVVSALEEVRERHEGVSDEPDNSIAHLIMLMEKANSLQKEAEDKLSDAAAIHFAVLRELRTLGD